MSRLPVHAQIDVSVGEFQPEGNSCVSAFSQRPVVKNTLEFWNLG